MREEVTILNINFDWVDPGWIGCITGSLSLIISFAVSWFSVLRGAKVVGVLSGVEFKRFSSSRNGVVTDRKIIPIFCLKNLGARSVVIELLRLKFLFDDGGCYYAYPTSNAPDNGLKHFSGLPLISNETWKNTFHFSMKNESYEALTNRKGKIIIEIFPLGKKKWERMDINIPFSLEIISLSKSEAHKK